MVSKMVSEIRKDKQYSPKYLVYNNVNSGTACARVEQRKCED